MILKFDRSYMKPDTRKLIECGYAREVPNQLIFRFEYTEEQAAQNRTMAATLSKEAWKSLAERETLRRSGMMEPVMNAIAEKFTCYQYDPEASIVYRSAEWDLYFYCRRRDVPDAEGPARDFSYFTLSFNREHTVEQRMEICGRVIQLLQARFAAHPNLRVSVQYMGWLDAEKIHCSVQRALPSLDGKRCVYHNYEGRVVLAGDQIFFMKKHAKTRGFALSEADALLISLEGAA